MTKPAPNATFDTFFESISRLDGQQLPNVLNAEYFSERHSPPANFKLVRAYRFLNLTDDADKPTDRLRLLVSNAVEPLITLRGYIIDSYSDIFEQNVSSMDKDTLYRIMNTTYGLTNDSAIKKAMSFFRHACDKTGIKLNAKLTDRSTITATVERTDESLLENYEPDNSSKEELLAIRELPTMQEIQTQAETATKNVDGFDNTIVFKSGGELTLLADVNVWKLHKADREFLFSLVDLMNEYESNG
jgi:hypothetical protein